VERKPTHRSVSFKTQAEHPGPASLFFERSGVQQVEGVALKAPGKRKQVLAALQRAMKKTTTIDRTRTYLLHMQ